MNKGFRTTEFWLSIIAIIGTLLPTLLGMLSAEKAALISSILVACYTISRTVVKATTSVNDDKIVEAIENHIINQVEPIAKKK